MNSVCRLCEKEVIKKIYKNFQKDGCFINERSSSVLLVNLWNKEIT